MGGGIIPLGTLTLTNVTDNSSESSLGVRTLANGVFQFNNGIWNDNDFGVEWIDDGGASAAQFEAQLEDLNTTETLTFLGWSGFDDWQPCNQTLQAFGDFATGFQMILNLHIREIANTSNTVTSFLNMTSGP